MNDETFITPNYFLSSLASTKSSERRKKLKLLHIRVLPTLLGEHSHNLEANWIFFRKRSFQLILTFTHFWPDCLQYNSILSENIKKHEIKDVFCSSFILSLMNEIYGSHTSTMWAIFNINSKQDSDLDRLPPYNVDWDEC